MRFQQSGCRRCCAFRQAEEACNQRLSSVGHVLSQWPLLSLHSHQLMLCGCSCSDVQITVLHINTAMSRLFPANESTPGSPASCSREARLHYCTPSRLAARAQLSL